MKMKEKKRIIVLLKKLFLISQIFLTFFNGQCTGGSEKQQII